MPGSGSPRSQALVTLSVPGSSSRRFDEELNMQSQFIRPRRRKPKSSSEPLADLVVNSRDFDRFQPALFGLDSYHNGLGARTALAVVIDLENFTKFTANSDPHLFVPDFIDRFISWFFTSFRKSIVDRSEDDIVYLQTLLPFYVKYLGDGLLLLWEIDYQGSAEYAQTAGTESKREIQGDLGNLISILRDICNLYTSDFLPEANTHYTNVPQRLRCGIAQGLVCDLGNGSDYVGPCINMASRLQKVAGLGIAILKRGIDLDLSQSHELAQSVIRKKCNIRGHGDEIIYVFKADFEALSEEDKRQLKDIEQ